MKITLLLIITFFLIASASLDTPAAPIPPLGPVDVTGTVSDVKWNPGKKIKGVPGMSGSAGIDRTMAAHFLVTLGDFKGVDSKTALAMTRYLDWEAFKDKEKNAMPSFIILKINRNDEHYLKKGMKIQVSGYTVRGDEGGTWTRYTKVDILDQRSQEDSILHYLETSIQSPNSGGKMFCAYELYGSETKKNRKYFYVWTVCMEHYVKGGVLRQGAGVSLPVSLIAEKTAHGDTIKGHKKPVDGEGWGKSIRQIFPQKYHKAIFAESQEYNRRAGGLLKETERKARAYYHVMQ